MKFQLVLQFAVAEDNEFDELVALEEILIQNLPPTCEFDGHDFGSGEFNIFDAARKPTIKSAFQKQLRAAYCEQGKDDYVILWRELLEKFSVA